MEQSTPHPYSGTVIVLGRSGHASRSREVFVIGILVTQVKWYEELSVLEERRLYIYDQVH